MLLALTNYVINVIIRIVATLNCSKLFPVDAVMCDAGRGTDAATSSLTSAPEFVGVIIAQAGTSLGVHKHFLHL